MSGRVFISVAAVALLGVQVIRTQTPSTTPYRAVIDQYCVSCHNSRLKTGGLALDGLDLAKVAQDAEVWEKVVRKVRVGMMPPQSAEA